MKVLANIAKNKLPMDRQTIGASFANAFNGLMHFLRHDRNGRIELGATVLVITAAVVLHATTTEWLIILLCIGAVLCLEMLNSAVEKLCDMVHKDYHPTIKIIKDVAAGAVLLACIISVVIACIIFLPRIF